MASTESDLFSFGEKFVDSTVQNQFADLLERHQFFRPHFRRIQDIKVKVMLAALRDGLNSELPSGICPMVDGLVQVFAVEIWILTRNFECFIPEKTVDAEFGNEMKFNEMAIALAVQKSVRIDAETLHHAKRTRDTAVRHDPHYHVGR